jgi:hypothetical protein
VSESYLQTKEAFSDMRASSSLAKELEDSFFSIFPPLVLFYFFFLVIMQMLVPLLAPVWWWGAPVWPVLAEGHVLCFFGLLFAWDVTLEAQCCWMKTLSPPQVSSPWFALDQSSWASHILLEGFPKWCVHQS